MESKTMFGEIQLSGNEKIKKVKWALLTMVRHPWEHGTAAQAFMNAGDEEVAVLMAHEAVYRQSTNGRLAVTNNCNNITDPCVCGESVMFAYKKTGEEKYKIAAEKMLDYIDHAPATAEGIQFHNTSSSMIAADCLYMVAPFYAVMGRFRESVRQVDLRFNFLWDEEKQSVNHQYDAANNRWIRKLLWGGGIGWNAAGIVQVLKKLPSNMVEEKQRLIGYLNKLLAGALKYQLENGLFYDVFDDPGTFVETNAAQMIAYSIYRGVHWGFLDPKYISAADRMRNAANAKVDEMGFVQGCSGAPSFDFYGISPEGQAFYILMETAANEYKI
jgi:unsaturated rhamnogalacturonyl hydrolase